MRNRRVLRVIFGDNVVPLAWRKLSGRDICVVPSRVHVIECAPQLFGEVRLPCEVVDVSVDLLLTFEFDGLRGVCELRRDVEIEFGWPAGGSKPAVPGRARTSRTWRSGRCPPGSSAPGCTTWPRTGGATESLASTPSRSGRAASASGVASASACRGRCGWPGVGASRCCPCSTAAAPALAARPGHRPVGQLLEPGAVRRADHAAVGPGDRPGQPAAGYTQYTHLPPDVPATSRCGTWPCAACCC